MSSAIDTIPGEIGPETPIVQVGVPFSGWFTNGADDRDILQIDLLPDQSYLLDFQQGYQLIGSADLLDTDGQIIPGALFNYTPAEDFDQFFYDQYAQTMLRVDAPTTFFLSIAGIWRHTVEYTVTLDAVGQEPATDGDDILVWSDAFAHYDGGAGTDTLSFETLESPVRLQLSTGRLFSDAFAETPSRVAIEGVERIAGTTGDDLLLGDYFRRGYEGVYDVARESRLETIEWQGLAGDDTLGSTAGPTAFFGGEGRDTASYAGSDTAVNVSLAAGRAADPQDVASNADGDTFDSIEVIQGSWLGDVLEGDDGDNLLLGGRGQDTLIGLGGDDTLDGELASYYGPRNGENETARYLHNRADYVLTAEYDEDWQLTTTVAHDGGNGSEGTDTLRNIELIEFADQTISPGSLVDDHPDSLTSDVVVVAEDQTFTMVLNSTTDRDIVGLQVQAGRTYQIDYSILVERGQNFTSSFSLTDGSGEIIYSGVDLDYFRESEQDPLFTFMPAADDTYYVSTSAEIYQDAGTSLALQVVELTLREATDLLVLGAEDDTFNLTDQAFYIDAGAGRDTLDLASSPNVSFNITNTGPTVLGPETTFMLEAYTGAHLVTNVEVIVGSPFNDRIKQAGDGPAVSTIPISYLLGTGNDYANSTFGATLIDGGPGFDTVSYATDAQWQDGHPDMAVSIDLSTQTYSGGMAEGDTLIGVERITGSNFDDTLIGGLANDVLEGAGGNDRLVGGAGDDILSDYIGINIFVSGEGSDTVNGGQDYDTIVLPGATGEYLYYDGRIIAQDDSVSFSDIEAFQFADRLLRPDDLSSLTLSDKQELNFGDLGDVITDTTADEVVHAGGGADWINYQGGDDVIIGGGGNDMVSLNALRDPAGIGALGYRATVDLGAGKIVGAAGEDITLLDVERITGTIHADYITGDGNDNLLRGSGGWDWFIASHSDFGGDTIDGGTGRDTISFVNDGDGNRTLYNDVFLYANDPLPYYIAGVKVDLASPNNNSGMAQGLNLISVERVTGTSFQDVFVGDDTENEFRGLGGYDWFYASEGGRERYDGGDGRDTVNYRDATGAISASLRNGAEAGDGSQTGFGTAGWASLDLFVSIENLIGSAYDDSLIGSDEINYLDGLGGNDTLSGWEGNDHLRGGAGDDFIDGGDGADYAYYAETVDQYEITRTANKDVTISYLGEGEGTDTLVDVEYFDFQGERVAVWDLDIV